MATIHIQKASLTTKVITPHSIPFYVHADCDADVKRYFDTTTKCLDKQKGTYRASFRGYPLLGKKVTFPEGYTGLLLHESIQPMTAENERRFYIVNDFSELMFWNWDKEPSDNDSLTQALQWIDVAEALHAPVTTDDL